MFRHVLVPIDDHPGCAAAVRHAFALTRAIGGRVTLLHLLESELAADRQVAGERLNTLAIGARRPPDQVVLSVRNHDVVDAVSTFARQRGADLIVVGMRGEGGLEDEAIGALAVKLAHASGRPVQVIEGGRHHHAGRRWETLVTGGAALEAAAPGPGERVLNPPG